MNDDNDNQGGRWRKYNVSVSTDDVDGLGDRDCDAAFLAGARAGLEAAADAAFDEAACCDKYSLAGQACVRVGDAIRTLDPNKLEKP